MGNIIGAIVLGVVAIACFIISYFQFHEKGFPFNNVYLFASKQERETMDKKPYFKQSGILFVMLGIICAINAVDKILKTGWLFYAVIVVVVITLVYAIVSSIAIANMKK